MSTLPPPTDPGAARIITHMNADHQDSLIRYLEHYHGVPSSLARHATLLTITHTYMLISVSPAALPTKGPLTPTNTPLHTTYTIPLDPPLASFSEARARVVAMDKLCVAALGRDPITLTHYITPAGLDLDLVITVSVLLTFLTFHRRANLDAGTAPALVRPLLERFPAAAAFLYGVQPWVLYPMVVVHAGEAWWMDRTRLRRHGVPRFGGVWWMWIVGTFVAGFPHFQKLDAWVEGERRAREKKAH